MLANHLHLFDEAKVTAGGKIFHKSYGNQSGELWSPNRRLLATTLQIAYFKA